MLKSWLVIVEYSMSRLKLLLKLVQELYHCVCWKRHISKVLKSLSWLRKRYFLQFPEDNHSENYIEVMYIVLSEFWWHDANSMFLILQKKVTKLFQASRSSQNKFCQFLCSLRVYVPLSWKNFLPSKNQK